MAKIISCSKEIKGGSPVFFNTEIPINSLLNTLKNGGNTAGFLKNVEGVSNKHASKVLSAVGHYDDLYKKHSKKHSKKTVKRQEKISEC